jgi:O-methyltransferase involved in polyketide biosynthesis
MPAGSGIVFDYMISPLLLNSSQRKVLDGLAHRVALAGEPFQTFYDPSLLMRSMRTMGFAQTEDMTPEEMNARYFQGRSDNLRVGSLAHVMNARV